VRRWRGGKGRGAGFQCLAPASLPSAWQRRHAGHAVLS
jgi:hypothetical protein